MKNRNIKNKISILVSVFIVMLIMGSCERYLDKAPEATITEKDVFGNFVSFQGFVEEMYNCIVDYQKAGANKYDFLYADEALNTGYNFTMDQGDYWSQDYMLYGSSPNTDNSSGSKRIWPLAWYGIRKANMALANLDRLNGTEEEKALIKGQALFFRGWFHFELMRYWGGLPYIDTVLSSSGNINLPRLNYRQTALLAAKDFRAAADILPVNWDETEVGKVSSGNNRKRINKVHALAYLGKDLLYAASPMMNEESTGSNSYDAELCKEAANAFWEAIKTCNETGMYTLQPWATWTDIFWVWSPDWKSLPGGTEVIMNSPPYDPNMCNWRMFTTPIRMGGNNGVLEYPTHNYIKNYGMANGLPIDDPASGFNPDDPWTGRDPRFYKDIIVDGDKIVNDNRAGVDQYAQMFNGGIHRTPSGYYYKRYSPIGYNKWEHPGFYFFTDYAPFMRLSDVYLMYAEAVNWGYASPTAQVPTSGLTAADAVNAIKNRAQLPDVDSKFLGSPQSFMEMLIQERAVEFAFETNHRFHDLRRWNIASQEKYLNKTGLDFQRGPDGKPINMVEKLLIRRVVEKKHNWFPFKTSFTMLYPEFKQNPGW